MTDLFGRIHGANLPEKRPVTAPGASGMRGGTVPASFLAKLRGNASGGVIEATDEERAALRGERPGE